MLWQRRATFMSHDYIKAQRIAELAAKAQVVLDAAAKKKEKEAAKVAKVAAAAAAKIAKEAKKVENALVASTARQAQKDAKQAARDLEKARKILEEARVARAAPKRKRTGATAADEAMLSFIFNQVRDASRAKTRTSGVDERDTTSDAWVCSECNVGWTQTKTTRRRGARARAACKRRRRQSAHARGDVLIIALEVTERSGSTHDDGRDKRRDDQMKRR